jgi:hypothetical protein
MCRALYNITERANAVTISSPEAQKGTHKSRPLAEASKQRGKQGNNGWLTFNVRDPL